MEFTISIYIDKCIVIGRRLRLDEALQSRYESVRTKMFGRCTQIYRELIDLESFEMPLMPMGSVWQTVE